jgi:hypothetical protein
MTVAKQAATVTPVLIMNKIKNSFDALGRKNGTAFPASENNREHYAVEYHIASELAKYADARKKTAASEAVKAGVLIDPIKEPRNPGTNEVLFQGENVQVQLSVKNATTNYDIDAIRSSLVSQGVDTLVIDNAFIDGTRQNRAPHSFKTILLTNRTQLDI